MLHSSMHRGPSLQEARHRAGLGAHTGKQLTSSTSSTPLTLINTLRACRPKGSLTGARVRRQQASLQCFLPKWARSAAASMPAAGGKLAALHELILLQKAGLAHAMLLELQLMLLSASEPHCNPTLTRWPRSTRLAGESGSMTPPMSMSTPGTPAHQAAVRSAQASAPGLNGSANGFAADGSAAAAMPHSASHVSSYQAVGCKTGHRCAPARAKGSRQPQVPMKLAP